MLLCEGLPVAIMADLGSDDWDLLDNKWIDWEMSGDIHDREFLERTKHIRERRDLIEKDFVHKFSQLSLQKSTFKRLFFL